MPEAITIRACEPEDVRATAEVMAQPRAVWGTLQLPFTSIEHYRQRWATNPPQGQLVAVLDERVIGCAGLTQYDNRRKHVGSVWMAVHDAHTGRGAGTALLAALLERADRWLNLTRIELTVWVDNDRAIRLYERFGFEREGLLRGFAFRDGVFIDAITMARLRL